MYAACAPHAHGLQACRDFGYDLATAQQLVAEAEQAELLIKAARTRQSKWPDAVAQHSAPIMCARTHHPASP